MFKKGSFISKVLSCALAIMLVLPCSVLVLPSRTAKAAFNGRSSYKEYVLKDHIKHTWESQIVTYDVSFSDNEADFNSLTLASVDSQGTETSYPFQVYCVTYFASGKVQTAKLSFMTNLPSQGEKKYRLYYGVGTFTAPTFTSTMSTTGVDTDTLEVNTGAAYFRIAKGSATYSGGTSANNVPKPIQEVKGPDAVWRGTARFSSDFPNIYGYSTETVVNGPTHKAYKITYDLGSSNKYIVTLSFHENSEYMLVDEETAGTASGKFEFSMYTGFTPDKYITNGSNESLASAAAIDYASVKALRLIKDYQYCFDASQSGSFIGIFNSGTAVNDLIGFLAVNRGSWRGPDQANAQTGMPSIQIVLRQSTTDLYMQYYLANNMKRSTALTIFSEAKNSTKVANDITGGTGPNYYLEQLLVRLSETPLNEVKDWTLSWTDTRTGPVLITSTDWTNIKSKINSDPFFYTMYEDTRKKKWDGIWMNDKPNNMDDADRVLMYEMTGDIKYINYIKNTLNNAAQYCLKGRVNFALYDNYIGSGSYNPPEIRDDLPYIVGYDYLANRSDVLTTDEKNLYKAYMAMWAYKLADPDYMLYQNGELAGPANYNTDRVALLNAIALVLVDHPDRTKWLNHCKDEFNRAMDYHVASASGSEVGGKWTENPSNYTGTSLGSYSWMLYFRNKLGIDNLASNTKYVDLLKYYLGLSTPITAWSSTDRDDGDAVNTVASGRLIPGIGAYGKTGANPVAGVAAAAKLISDTTLQKNLNWLMDQSPKEYKHYNTPNGGTPNYGSPNWVPVVLPLVAFDSVSSNSLQYPSLKSTAYNGMGVVMRGNNVNSSDETYAVFSKPENPNYRWGNENNSLVYYEHGALLVPGADENGLFNHVYTKDSSGNMKIPSKGGTTELTSFGTVDYMKQVSPSGATTDPLPLLQSMHSW